MQVLSCARVTVQAFHRVFAVFVWQSSFERTSRSNLFRRIGDGGLGLSHLFIKQVVSRFLFLRDQQDPFVRTCLQILLATALPDFLVSTVDYITYRGGGYLREVVAAFRFLSVRFSLEYLSNVSRKRLSRDLIDTLFPEPLYRSMYSGSTGSDVLKRVKKLAVPGGIKTFFFNLHTNTLPVMTWQEKMGLYLPWGPDCYLCKRPESVEHVFLDCWDAVFFWDVLQRTIKKDLPLNARGIRYLDVTPDVIPYDLIFLLGLHAIWRSRVEVRHNDVNARSVQSHFVENVYKVREVLNMSESDEEVLSMFNRLIEMKVHWHLNAT